MPTPVVKTKRQEKLWRKAEELTKKRFGEYKSHYDYVMGIYKNMGGLKEDFISKVKSYLKNV